MNKKTVILFLALSLLTVFSGYAQASISSKDLTELIGSWQGSLTYLDYTSNKPYTMPANMDIMQLGKTNSFIFSNIYPDEPKANAADTVIISADGKVFDGETVTSKQVLENGNTQIITERPGKDGNDNKPALIRHTYTFGKYTYTNIKEVQFTGQTAWIKRHEYSYRRK